MKVLVTGVSGQLGFDVIRVLQRRGIEAVSASRKEMPLTEPPKCASFIKETKPDAVIHCAAYTAVDKAEDEQELCRLINAESVKSIAEACDETGAKLIYISTDYVFPGTGDSFYSVDDKTGPCNAYGRSK
ncbi:SDR family oxidoreductase, partial [Schwartzia sp. (in: firmicutes)]